MKRIIKNSVASKIDNRLSPTSERYKGYLIVLDRGGYGYNVYDRHRELEDAGYPSKAAAKNFIDELVATDDDVYSAESVEYSAIKMIITVGSGINADGFDISIVNDAGDQLFKSTYSYGYNASYDRKFADWAQKDYDNSVKYGWANKPTLKPYVSDIIDGLCEKYNVTDIEVVPGKNVYRGNQEDISKIDEFKSKYLSHISLNSAKNVTSASYGEAFDIEDDQYSDWRELASKSVEDSDGFNTDYTLYTNGETYICMFGDKDLYEPDEAYADYETENEQDAWDWFNSYTGFADEEDEYDIYGSEDLESDFNEYEDDIQEISQEFTSENTSINSTKLPAIFKMVSFEPGTINIDYGGGRFDNVAEYLTQYDVINLVYDPYNRTPEHNKEVLKTLRRAGGADTATCSNVLNVIKEPEVRKNVLENISKIVKPGGKIYITVYEGSGKGDEGPTKAGYQLNRRTADYLDEIREVFPDATRKGKLIVATNSRTVNNSTNIKASSTEGYVYTYCDECGKKNRVKVTFNNFNEPFNDTKYKCKYCGTNNLLTDPHSYDENGNVVEASQSYLDRIEELMEQGLDEETASREAYAEFYPDEYDADDYDDSIYSSESSNVNNMKYWYFTKHGVQPGSIPKYVNVLDIIDKPEGSYFLTDTIINTKDLYDYEIKEAIPEDVDSCSEIEANYNVAIDKLHNELYNKIVKYGLSEGFPENEIDDYFFVTVLKAYDHIECEVRAEVDYEGLEALCDLLNPVVQKYEPAAYFEPVTSGIIEAYIYPTGKNKALFASKGSNDTDFMILKHQYKNMRKFDDMDSQSADILDLEDELNSHNTPYERYEHKADNGCTIFYDDYIKGQEFKNSDLTERETLYYKGKKFVVHYTVKDTYDAKEAFDSFKASISMIAPYDDADYYWARIYNGMIKYIYKGKVMRVNYYFNPEDMSDDDPNHDWNVEDWYSGICDEVVQALYEANKRIKSKMVHN